MADGGEDKSDVVDDVEDDGKIDPDVEKFSDSDDTVGQGVMG